MISSKNIFDIRFITATHLFVGVKIFRSESSRYRTLLTSKPGPMPSTVKVNLQLNDVMVPGTSKLDWRYIT